MNLVNGAVYLAPGEPFPPSSSSESSPANPTSSSWPSCFSEGKGGGGVLKPGRVRMMRHHTSNVLRAAASCERTGRRLCVLFSHQKKCILLSNLNLMWSTEVTREAPNLESQGGGTTANKRWTKG